MLGLGLAVLLFVGGISAIVKDARMNDAEYADYREQEIRALNSARSAHKAMMAGVWTGTGMIVVGLPLTITGAVLKSQARSGVARRLDVRGTGLTLRF